jgi:hypothetical protein
MNGRVNRRVLSGAVTACGLAVVISVSACSDRSVNRTAANGTAADDSTARPPMTLTGCLQKGDLGSDYILTEVNHSPTSVGTSGKTTPATDDAVGKEQVREAARAYKLAADGDTLEPLVGKQVRVNGTVEQKSKLNDHNADGTLKDRDRTKIDDDDLASVRVSSIDEIGETCGAR